MWGKVLHSVVHKVKTGFGLTQKSYAFSPDLPIHGPGQGSKGGPSSCSTMTSLLIDGMPRLCNGLQFTDPAQSLEYTATVSMFMDDASNSTNKFLEWLQVPPDLTELVEMTRHDAQSYERLLWTSGGLLNLLKCAFYGIAWQFDAEGRATYMNKQAIPNLRLTFGNNPGSSAVTQLNFDETHAYLVNKLATVMQMKDALSALTKTAASFSSRLLCSSLSPSDTWVAYFAVFVPSMIYSLPISQYSAKSLETLQSAPTRAALMKIGFNRNTAHRVVYGPSRYGGLGFRDLFVEQGVPQVQLLVQHLRAGTTQGILMLITLSWWQMVVGVSYPLLGQTDKFVPFDAPHWLSSIREFLQSVEASIHIDNLHLPQPHRDSNVCIMDVIHDLPGLTRPQLRAFNRCRIFLGVHFLSEIVTADGRILARDAWEGSRNRVSTLLWPYQPLPGPKSFRAWRRLLATEFLQGHTDDELVDRQKI
jgi:hypothetical protein